MRTPDLPEPDLRMWASQQLGVPAEASAREARVAFLRQLGDHHFVPPPALQESVDWWMRPAENKMFPSLTEQAFCEEENRLRDQVDEFARDYFTLERTKRQRRHRVLVEQCAWSLPLKARLERLAGGLDLDAEPWQRQSPPRREVVEHLCRLFVLPPKERARRRDQVVRDCRENAARWQAAARGIQQDAPELVALEPFLIDELAWGKTRRTAQRPRLPKPMSPAPAPPAPSDTSGSKWGVVAIVLVVLGIIRVVASHNSTPTPRGLEMPAQKPIDFQEFQRRRKIQQEKDQLQLEKFNKEMGKAVEEPRDPVLRDLQQAEQKRLKDQAERRRKLFDSPPPKGDVDPPKPDEVKRP